MLHVGIDLGDHSSSIAHVNSEGIPTLVPDVHDEKAFRTPSLVHVGANGCLVGEPVAQLLAGEPDLPVGRHTKRALGAREPVLADHAGRDWSPAAVNSLILAKLANDATVQACDELGETVIAVPAHFGDAQRRAVRRAGELAGFASVTLVDEPIAAASYLLSRNEREQTVLVYDLGSSGFSATVLRCSPDEISILATEHDQQLGGNAIDASVTELMIAEFERVHGPGCKLDAADRQELLRIAEQIKLKLCQPTHAQVHHIGLVGNRPFEFLLTRHHFEQLVQPHITNSVDCTEQCLESAGVSWDEIDQILLVGGSTLLPAVSRTIAARSGKPIDQITHRQPQDSIAFGAAMLASTASSEQRTHIPAMRQSIATFDLGVRIRDPRSRELAVYNLIKRNSSLPSAATKVFKTSREDQTRLVIEVVQSRGNAVDALSLGNFSFGPIEKPRSNYPVEISMQYDAEGLVEITARDAETGIQMAHSLTSESKFETSTTRDAERDLVREAIGEFAM